MPIQIDINKARDIAHEKRREVRAKAFEPLDKMIAAQIPGVDIEDVEAERQKIRDANAALQSEIDAATDAAELLAIVKGIQE